jgi:ribonuclease HI
MQRLTINCDGGSRGNPGPSASAFVAYGQNKIIHKENKFLGLGTNNYAEYSAILLACNWLKSLSPKPGFVDFILDSELVTKQLKGEYKIKNLKLLLLAQEIKKKLKDLKILASFTFVPRSKNKHADMLVNMALDKELS